MTHFRSFRNGDSAALAELWNRGVPSSGVAGPLTAHEFDDHVAGKPNFEGAGLIVAERDGRIIGYVHAGFGPDDPAGAPNRFSYDLGTIAMLVVEPGLRDAEIEDTLIAEAERYLRQHGARVIYAGGQLPLNPFYWGIYGGSEWAGILSSHATFLQAVGRAGFDPVANTVLLEADLSAPETRDPKAPLIRRQTRLEVVEDSLPSSWWESLAIGLFRPTRFRLLAKSSDQELAWATTWDMNWFGRRDGRSRIGLVDMGVDASERRKGFGRHLVAEILRWARSEAVAIAALQTRATNAPALALYQTLGFAPVDTTTLFRKRAEAPAAVTGS